MNVNMQGPSGWWVLGFVVLGLGAGRGRFAGPGTPEAVHPPGAPEQEQGGLKRNPMQTRSASHQGDGFARFESADLERALSESGRAYLEFLRVPSMNCGIYRLAAGAQDGQSPHREDEIYYCLKGRSKFTVGEEILEVAPGTTLFVGAGAEHRFFEIEEDLELLVVFASRPPEAKADGSDDSSDPPGVGDGGEGGDGEGDLGGDPSGARSGAR